MAKRVCTVPGCPTLTTSSRCEQHQRDHERVRGTRQQRGYNAQHERERRRWQTILDRQGWLPCARCHQPIWTGDPWHLDHTDDRTSYLGPSHPSCNTSAGGQAAHHPPGGTPPTTPT